MPINPAQRSHPGVRSMPATEFLLYLSLLLAIESEEIKLVTRVFEIEAVVNVKDTELIPSLHYAASIEQSRRVIRRLLDLGAHIKEIDGKGESVLFKAAESGHFHVVQELVANRELWVVECQKVLDGRTSGGQLGIT
jgi:ankyrin repeat protein